MANLQFNNLTFARKKFIGKIQTAENVRISVKNDIANVLSVGIDSSVTSYQATHGDVALFGKTNIRFLYHDGTSMGSSNYSADFTANMQSELVGDDSKLIFDVVTLDSKVDTNANTATLTILLEVSVWAYVTETTPYLCGGENVFCKTENAEVLTGANVVNYSTVIDESLTASCGITTVLLCESSLCIADYTLHQGVLHVSGEATVRLSYVSDGNIVTDQLPFAFDREIDAEALPADSQIRLIATPKATKVRLDISEETNTSFTAEITANILVEATQSGVIPLVADAYSSGCDYTLEKKQITTTLPCGSASATKQINVSLPIDQGKTPLTAVNIGATVTNCTSCERKALVEGYVTATLLCNSDVGIIGQDVELPYTCYVDIDYLMPACTSFAKVTATSLQLTNNGTESICNLCITVDSERDVDYLVTVSATDVPFDKTELPAILICVAHKGETTWQLAKSLHLSEEDLLATNPQLTSPLQEDARIVVFNKI